VPTNKAYQQWLKTLKEQIQQTQFRTAQRVNNELVLLYWQIGKSILEKQETLGWGAKVVEQLAKDLRKAFPEMKGFSPRNLKYMRAFAEAYPDNAIVQQVAAQIPWFHNCILLDKVKDPKERTWYIQQTLKHGWSRWVCLYPGVASES
jgi:predicted nuclease of restriction endonuclease-like (RecB) superfamily